MIADIITLSRIPFSLLLLCFPPYSLCFTALYILCGITDVLDGFLARKLHTESKKGATLDSIADLFFAGIYAVRIIPFLSVPCYIFIWAAIIAVTKVIGIIIASRKKKSLYIEHSFTNRITGILLFLLPLSALLADAKYGAILVCTVATVTAVKEIINLRGFKMTVKTKRLNIYPASNEQMESLIASQTVPELKEAYSQMLDGCLKHPNEREWYAIWNIELNDKSKTAVGNLSFKGLGADGVVEIGYGIKSEYEGQGLMTEAVTAVVKWADTQKGVKRIEAETEESNIASQRVLLKSGFIPNGKTGNEGPRYVYRPFF